MTAGAETTRLLAWKAFWMGNAGLTFQRAKSSMAKLDAGDVALESTSDEIQILGYYDYRRDYPVGKGLAMQRFIRLGKGQQKLSAW